MARRSAVFLPLDVNFMDEKNVLRAGEQAAWLYLAMCMFCKRTETDGVMDELQIDRLGIKDWRKRLERLLNDPKGEHLVVELPLQPGEYGIPAFLKHNPSAEQLHAQRAKDRLRKTPSGNTEGNAA